MKRFLCLLCILLISVSCAVAEPEIILPETETMPVYAAIPRDFTQVVKPELFNTSGIAEMLSYKQNVHSVTFADEAQLLWSPETLYYNEYDGTYEAAYELAESGEIHTELLPKPSMAEAAGSLAGWMTFGWPETNEVYKLENEELPHITLKDAQERAEQLLDALGMEGYACEVALDMSLDRIREMGEKWNLLIDRGVMLINPRLDYSLATPQDEGYFLRFRRFGSESDLGGQFYADLYVTAQGFAYVYICDLYANGEVLSIPETLINWQDAAETLPEELATSRMKPQLDKITIARLTWCPVRDKTSPSGMAFVPAWVLAFDALSDGELSNFHAIFNAVTASFITGNWY